MTMIELEELVLGEEAELGGWLTIEKAPLSAGTKDCRLLPDVAEPARGEE